MSTTNGGPVEATASNSAPQLMVLAQYIKDLSFENPNAPGSLQQTTQPQINISVNVVANPMSDTDIEVTLRLEGKAEAAGSVMFNIELEFAGVFRIQNVPQEQVQPLVLIECPRLLFPFAREIIATSVRNGGFPPLMLDPIDFVALYQQRMAQQRRRRPRPNAGSVLPPDRGFAQRRDKGAVSVELFRHNPRRQRLRARANDDRRHARFAAATHARGKAEVGLPRADQLDIDLGQQLGVEQRAVLDPLGVVDLVARAEIVEPVRAAGMLAARQHQRVDQPLARHRRLLGALELGIEEAEIEHGVVRDQRRVAEEFDQLFHLVREQRLVLEEIDAEPMHLEGRLRACRVPD